MINSDTIVCNVAITTPVNTEKGVYLITLTNGITTVTLTNIGASIIAIYTPDKHGNSDNIVAGFNNINDYLINKEYFGCTVGRFANRIANGSFVMAEKQYILAKNDGKNHLHGGTKGFSHKLWQLTDTFKQPEKAGVTFSYTSNDGEEGYPGQVDITVTYSLDDENNISIAYKANTTKATPVNLTNHSYFNLSGFKKATILTHQLWLQATHYTPKNSDNIPTGEIQAVYNTPFDFTTPKLIGTHIKVLTTDKGYDHNFVIDKTPGQLSKAAGLYDVESGRTLTVYTTKPAIQVYTANYWDGSIIGSQQVPYKQHGAVALETQLYPDSPNHAHFPNCILQPEETYQATTIFKLSVQ